MKGILIGIAVLVVLTASYLQGLFKLKMVELVDCHIIKTYQIGELLGPVSYQGGFPQIPRPAPLKIGIACGFLVLYSLKGEAGTIPYQRIRKIDYFTTRTKGNLRNKSVVFWGPLVLMIFKDKYRHFALINYIDINNDENNLLLELKDRETCREFSGIIRDRWYSFRNSPEMSF